MIMVSSGAGDSNSRRFWRSFLKVLLILIKGIKTKVRQLLTEQKSRRNLANYSVV